MSKLDFCERFIYVKKRLFSFAQRPYLVALYNSAARRLVIRASRQVEKTTFLVNTILHAAVHHPGINILFVCPRQEQARVFSKARLWSTILSSPLVRRGLLGCSTPKMPVMNLQFKNDSKVFVRAAYRSGDPVRGIDADMLLVDEFQDIADGHLPVLEETLSHSDVGKIILTGTPKTIDNHLESYFRQSTAHEFKVPCRQCRHNVLLDERCLGLHGPICPDCLQPIEPTEGRWIARNPTSTWGDGFWINHLMVPWGNYAELLEKQRTYDPARFRNECLGLPTALGDHIVTREELEACCENRPMAVNRIQVPAGFADQLVAGIDWGGGAHSQTVLVLGYMDPSFRFMVVRLERFRAQEDPNVILEEIGRRCRRFQVRFIAADAGGNGHVYNRLLYERLETKPSFYAILYSTTGQAPVRQGVLQQWSVGRSASIGNLFARIKRRSLRFPRLADCSSFLDEIACEFAEFDDENRTTRFSHPDTQPDDTLHATNYAVILATLLFHQRRQLAGE